MILAGIIALAALSVGAVIARGRRRPEPEVAVSEHSWIEARIVRANGDVEELGIVSRSDGGPE